VVPAVHELPRAGVDRTVQSGQPSNTTLPFHLIGIGSGINLQTVLYGPAKKFANKLQRNPCYYYLFEDEHAVYSRFSDIWHLLA